MGNKTTSTPGQMETELASLLSDIRAGHGFAFTRLVERYDALLWSRIRVYNTAESEEQDAYQEACLALHRAAMHYYVQDEVTFGLYAKVCIDNALKTKYKKDGRARAKNGTVPPDFVPFEECRFLTRFSDHMVEEENFAELLSLIHSELSDYERCVFELYINDVTPAEIAKRLGREEKSVKNAVSRLIRKLRKKLGH